MKQHTPFGCPVEESLDDPLKIYATKVIPGSFANQAELQVGDVMIGVLGFFETMTPTVGLDHV